MFWGPTLNGFQKCVLFSLFTCINLFSFGCLNLKIHKCKYSTFIMMVPLVLYHRPTNTKEEWLDWQRFRYPSTTYNISDHRVLHILICIWFAIILNFSCIFELAYVKSLQKTTVFHTAPQEVLQNWPLCSFAS